MQPHLCFLTSTMPWGPGYSISESALVHHTAARPRGHREGLCSRLWDLGLLCQIVRREKTPKEVHASGDLKGATCPRETRPQPSVETTHHFISDQPCTLRLPWTRPWTIMGSPSMSMFMSPTSPSRPSRKSKSLWDNMWHLPLLLPRINVLWLRSNKMTRYHLAPCSEGVYHHPAAQWQPEEAWSCPERVSQAWEHQPGFQHHCVGGCQQGGAGILMSYRVKVSWWCHMVG